jgi:hypothetical protein
MCYRQPSSTTGRSVNRDAPRPRTRLTCAASPAVRRSRCSRFFPCLSSHLPEQYLDALSVFRYQAPVGSVRPAGRDGTCGTTATRPLVMTSVNLTIHLPAERREHVEARLHGNLMAWLTTVRPDGQPDSVPVWFLMRDDETILVYSQPKRSNCATSERTLR